MGGDGGPSGVPSHLRHLAAALAGMAEVAVVSEPDRGGYGWTQDASVRRIEVEGLASSLSPVSMGRGARGLSKALDALRPDLVWAHARMTLPLARALARRRGWRLATTYHGLPFGPGHGAMRSASSMILDAVSLRLAPPHHVVFLTDEDRAAFPGPPRARHTTHVLPNTSDVGGFAPRAARASRMGPLRVTMLTRDAPQKNLELAARIFARMGQGAELSLHGMGTEAPGLRARLSPLLGAALPRVRFGGPAADVRSVLAKSDLLLVTSRYEGLSIAALEAMEWGLPVASTPVGGSALLARHHPLFTLLDPTDLDGAARHLRALAVTFREDPARHGAAIHAAWRGAFSPDVFHTRACSLLMRFMA